MRRRVLLSGLLLAPLAARAQETADLGRPGLRRGSRPGVDEALRRTVTLVLRAEARSGTLPDFMADPAPLDEAVADAILPGGPIPGGLDYRPVPENIDRRLPHARRGSVWVAAGPWMIEIDPVRRLVVLIAHDVLPPEM
jgi:hypothetical protein